MTVNDSAERLNHLLNQIRWITRNSVALGSAAEVDDVYAILGSALVSPIGPAFTRVLLFDLDPGEGRIRGRFAIGYESQSQMEALQQELLDELRFLEQASTRPFSEDEREVHLEHLANLQQGTPWVTVFQKLGTDTTFSHQLARMEFCYNPGRKTPRGLFEFASAAKAPCSIDLREASIDVPPELAPVLAREFALVPYRTKRGTIAVMFVDRELVGGSIEGSDLETLEWFATQGSLALQNSELIGDLERAYEELKAVDQLKSGFLSIISHELRTPLTAIAGFVDLILNGKVGPVTESQKGLLVRVAKNTGHLSDMVNDVIEIAEIKAEGLGDVSLTMVDPLSTLFNTLPRLEYRRRDKRVDIDPKFEGSIPPIVCDQRALERIYFHLLDNAVKFSHSGDEITVTFEPVEDNKLAIRIRDTGGGIPDDKLQSIFDEFYQVDNSLTRSHEGLGLGLAVTKILVQSTRGEIRVKSEIGRGSEFTLIYPIAKA